VTPDAETAREWARAELDSPAYQSGESWADRIGSAISDFIAELFSVDEGGSVPVVGIVILLVIVGAVIAAVLLIAKPMIDQRRRRESIVLEEDHRSTAQIRKAAELAATNQDWDLAVLERFRAIISAMEDRVIIDERKGRTAYEAARDGGLALPNCASGLAAASLTFDEVCYGHRPAEATDYDSLTLLDEQVAKATPRSTTVDA
jgi:predicted alpha/beta hydrolase family esterase